MLNSRLFLKILTFLIPAIWDEKGIVSASSIQAQLALHIHPELLTASLLEGNESRVLHVGTSRVTDRLVSDGEFTEVVASHLRLNLDGGEGLAVVDTNNGTNHLGHDDHVSEVGLNHSRLLVGAGLSLGLSELLDETHGSSLKTSLEPPSGTGVDEVDELLVGKVEEVLKLDTPVLVLLERPGGLLGSGFLLSSELSHFLLSDVTQ